MPARREDVAPCAVFLFVCMGSFRRAVRQNCVGERTNFYLLPAFAWAGFPPPGLDIFFILLYSNGMTTASYIRLWARP